MTIILARNATQLLRFQRLSSRFLIRSVYHELGLSFKRANVTSILLTYTAASGDCHVPKMIAKVKGGVSTYLPPASRRHASGVVLYGLSPDSGNSSGNCHSWCSFNVDSPRKAIGREMNRADFKRPLGIEVFAVGSHEGFPRCGFLAGLRPMQRNSSLWIRLVVTVLYNAAASRHLARTDV